MQIRLIRHPWFRSATTAALCAQLALPLGLAAQSMDDSPARPTHAHAAPDASAKLSGDDRILLVLNRFTYGPRPGDVAKVREMGLSEWFRQQLNPNTIDDSALDARLAQYPAMQMPLDEMMRQFPTNNMVRKIALHNGNVMEPSGDNRAILKDRVNAYRAKLQQKNEARAATAAATSDAAGMDTPKATVPAAAPNQNDMNEQDQPLPVSLAELEAMQPQDRFHAILKFTPGQIARLQRQAGRDAETLTAGFTPQQMEVLTALYGPSEVIAREAVETKLLRDVYSQRQLQEVMVDFWLNHFNVYMKKNQEAPYMIAAFARDVIRPRALGNFTDLLLATAESPAMLEYLDQYQSVGPDSDAAHPRVGFNATLPKKAKDSGLNENYAREVMELHTVGVDAGYTQKDVTEMAKVLTGWTVTRRDPDSEPTMVTFDERKHEPGTKVVMGQVVKQDGVEEGIEMLRYLASTPQCAHFISEKLAVRFVSDDPPPAMVSRMAATFLATHGDIRKVLATMVNSPEFFTAATYRTKVKTPVDFVVSAVRATNADVENPQSLAKAIADLGMPIYGHQTPEGYSMRSDAWSSTNALVERMNFAMALATNRVQGVTVNLDQWLGPDAEALSAKQKQDEIEAQLLHAPVSPRTEALIAKQTDLPEPEQKAQLQQVSQIKGGERFARGKNQRPVRADAFAPATEPAADPDTQAAMATGLVLGSPEFQRR